MCLIPPARRAGSSGTRGYLRVAGSIADGGSTDRYQQQQPRAGLSLSLPPSRPSGPARLFLFSNSARFSLSAPPRPQQSHPTDCWNSSLSSDLLAGEPFPESSSVATPLVPAHRSFTRPAANPCLPCNSAPATLPANCVSLLDRS